ncbi:MAG: hypothetical protein ABJA78_08740 [Ferruginibacter sp.]
MIQKIIPAFFMLLFAQYCDAQQHGDTTITVGKNMILLKEVVVNNKLNVPGFIQKLKDDTSFYKAFRNLHILGFSAINDIRMLKRDGSIKASLTSKTKQIRENGCRKMQVLDEQITGDIYDDDKNFNYYTCQMYASLFFTKDSVCGEDNIVTGKEFSTSGKSGMEKHKEQLKKLFFNPGSKISGIPFISGKTAIFDDDMADKYDMEIDMDKYNGTDCYIFRIKVRSGSEDDVVIDEMTTWFDEQTNEVLGRNYSLSYDAGVYDFKVQMETQMTHFGKYLVPALIRYNGNWKAVFKDRERGVFTATLFDFN